MKAYKADRIFTGESWLEDHSVLVSEGTIVDLVPSSARVGEAGLQEYEGCFIAPAFIDLQIYGAYERLVAVYPEAESLSKLNEYCNKGGAAFCLPTAATNKYEVFYKCIDAIRDYWSGRGKGVLGLHIEGPWINRIKRGAHIESLVHSPTISQAEELLNYGKDVIKMITLAPEVVSPEIIELIRSKGIIISAGHSNATYAEANRGFSRGIGTVTHLFNAMSPFQHREPGLAGATMDHDKVMASIIPDGHHVDYAAVRIAKRVVGERLYVITDAVTETNDGFYQHTLVGDKYESSGILSGSALTLNKALKNLVDHCGISLEEGLRMCSLYPARVMGLENSLGRIDKGYSAGLVVLDKNLDVKDLIASG
jgi:N-acetylglucosamine-6-phosphate deacetylase